MTNASMPSRNDSCADEMTSLRSSEDGSVCTTSWSWWSRSFATDMRVIWSTVSCCLRSASTHSWRVKPPTIAATATTTDARIAVRQASSDVPDNPSASAIDAPVSAAAGRPSRYPHA